MTLDQRIGFAIMAIMLIGAVIAILRGWTPATRGDRYSQVARAPEPEKSVLESQHDAILDPVGNALHNPDPPPEWIRGMHGPKGRIMSKAQFDSLSLEERRYYHRKYLNNHGWPKVGE